MRHVNLSIACILLSAGTFPVDAQTAAFPSTITIYIAGGAGSGMDISSRILGRHFSRYLPGTPHVLVQVMPGAGGLIAVNYLAKIAPKDGSALLTLPAVTIIEPLVTTNSVSADLSQFQWIGSMYKDVIICLSTRASKFTTIEDARQREMLLAGTGTGSETIGLPNALNAVFGTKMRTVTGYRTTASTYIAMEQGEVDGRCGLSYASLKALKPNWREEGYNILIQVGAQSDPDLKDIPLARQIVKNQEDGRLIELVAGPNEISRPYVTNPGTDDSRVSILRRAFDKTMLDPAFMEEIKSLGTDVSSSSGEAVQQAILDLYGTPATIRERARKLLESKP